MHISLDIGFQTFRKLELDTMVYKVLENEKIGDL